MSFLVMSFVFVKTCVEKVFVHPPQIIELETFSFSCTKYNFCRLTDQTRMPVSHSFGKNLLNALELWLYCASLTR